MLLKNLSENVLSKGMVNLECTMTLRVKMWLDVLPFSSSNGVKVSVVPAEASSSFQTPTACPAAIATPMAVVSDMDGRTVKNARHDVLKETWID